MSHWPRTGVLGGVRGLLLVLAWPALANAQATTPTTAPESLTARVATDEQTLWLALSGVERVRIYRREASTPFTPAEPLNARLERIGAAGGALYAFVMGGGLYSLAADGWTRGIDLPKHDVPIDLVGDASTLYALVPSPTPGSLPLLRGAGTESGASSRPFDAGESEFSVVRYGSRGWSAVAACPPTLTRAGDAALQLALVKDALCVFWAEPDGGPIRYLRLDAESGQWHPGERLPAEPGLSGFWVTTVSRVPTLIAAVQAAEGVRLDAFRLLGGAQGGAEEWRPATLQLSTLPAGVEAAGYEAASGFNQHAVLLMVDQHQARYLRFGRIDAPPTEVTVSAEAPLERQRTSGERIRWVQGITLLALFAVLLALFLFRRGAMAAVATLPTNCALALTFQRLVGCLIDFTPIALVTGALLSVDWRTGLGQLFNWVPLSDASGKVPAMSTLLWWGASCAAYTVYTIVIELLMHRTVGKLVVGTRVLSEGGAAPAAIQIVVRNLFRLLELMPPFWVLAFLVVMSRNRQRLGDIFARTVVVRRVRPTPNPE